MAQDQPAQTLRGGGDGAADPCDIAEIVPLNSPRPPVVSTLALGQVLNVILSRTGSNPVLDVVTTAGAKAGALTHRNHVLSSIASMRVGLTRQS
jgi:hypothetical protein